ncbi:hypothetical protein PZH42_31055, partial [Bacteroides cellulosilyticus]
LKALTRTNQAITEASIKEFIEGLNVDEEIKKELRELQVNTHCTHAERTFIPLREIDGNVFPGSVNKDSGADTAYYAPEAVIASLEIRKEGVKYPAE